jgi:hypothetical protein
MEPHEPRAADPHECPAELGASETQSSDGEEDSPAARPSTAPQPDHDRTQSWGRLGHLTDAQEAHLASMRRKFPAAEDAEVCVRARSCFPCAR